MVQEKTFLGAISKAWTTASQVEAQLQGKYVLPLQKSHQKNREMQPPFCRNLFSTLAGLAGSGFRGLDTGDVPGDPILMSHSLASTNHAGKLHLDFESPKSHSGPQHDYMSHV